MEDGLEKIKKLVEKYNVNVYIKKVDLLVDSLLENEYDVVIMVFGYFYDDYKKMILGKMI